MKLGFGKNRKKKQKDALSDREEGELGPEPGQTDKMFTPEYRGKLRVDEDISLTSLDSSNHFNQLMNELQKGRKLHLTPKPKVHGPLGTLGVVHIEAKPDQSSRRERRRFLSVIAIILLLLVVGGGIFYTFTANSRSATGRAITEDSTDVPTLSPTSRLPTSSPTTRLPTALPTTMKPTLSPIKPTKKPTLIPTNQPTSFPTQFPTRHGDTRFPSAAPTMYPFADPCALATGSSTKFCYDEDTLGFCEEIVRDDGSVTYVKSDRVKVCPEEEEERVSCRCPDGLPFTFTYGCAFPRNVNTFCATSVQQLDPVQFFVDEYG